MATTIRKAIELDEAERSAFGKPSSDELEWEFAEGRLLTVIHVRRERNAKVRHELIAHRKKSGQLLCDLCRWTFESTIESFQEAAFEAHHLIPLAQLVEGSKTKLKDMALLCANCHRLIHRAIAIEKRWLGLEEAREAIGITWAQKA